MEVPNNSQNTQHTHNGSSSHDSSNPGPPSSRVSEMPDPSSGGFNAEPASILYTSPNESKLLDIIAQLHQHKVEEHYDMPQIIVCGYQSTGKSSVLEAITGVPFPRNISTCTKFVTQVTLVKNPRASIEVTIRPSEESSDERRRRLVNFNKTLEINAFGSIENILQEAENTIREDVDDTKFITRDIVHIKISGRDTKPLEVFDLPGLVGRDDGSNMKQDAEKIMRSYMKKPQAIILAVVRANGDSNGAETGILEWCQKEYDIEGTRSICVLTHPDQSGEREKEWISVLQGGASAQSFGFKGEWPVLCNWPANDGPENRDDKEHRFFLESRWSEVPEDCRGARALRDRLGTRLFSKLKQRLPQLASHLKLQLPKIKLELQQLGEEGKTVTERVKTFKKKLEQIRAQALACSKRDYGSHLSRFPNTGEVFLKSRVVDEGEQFRDNINKYGHVWESFISPLSAPRNPDLNSLSRPKAVPTEWETWRETFPDVEAEIESMRQKLDAKRGQASSWYPEPDLIPWFFWEMSVHWPDIANWHILCIINYCERYATTMVPYGFGRKCHQGDIPGLANAETVGNRYVQQYVLPKLNERREKALFGIESLDEDREIPIFSFDLDYLGEQRDYNHTLDFEGSVKARRTLSRSNAAQGGAGSSLAPIDFAVAAGDHLEMDHRKTVTRMFVQAAAKYYEIALNQWIANVMIQVVDRHILRRFEDAFPDDLTDEQIEKLLEEDPTLTKKRTSCRKRKQDVERLLDILEKEIG